MERTSSPESSTSCLRGAPASVVDRHRSGSSLRGVLAPWHIMRMGRRRGEERVLFGAACQPQSGPRAQDS
eukprot:1610919-Pleurochrysis_carterae.AAC.1